MAAFLKDFWMESVSSVTATKPTAIPLGTIRWEGDAMYQYVYNGDVNALNPGYGVAVQSGTSAYTVVNSSLSGVGAYFGIIKNATLTTGTYGWALRQGKATFIADTESFSTAYTKIYVGTSGTFQSGSFVSGASTAEANLVHACGYLLQASCACGASAVGRFNFM